MQITEYANNHHTSDVHFNNLCKTKVQIIILYTTHQCYSSNVHNTLNILSSKWLKETRMI